MSSTQASPELRSNPPSRKPLDETSPPEESQEKTSDYQFELHYGTSHNSVRDALLEVVEDLSSHRGIHNWDAKIVTTAFSLSMLVVRDYIKNSGYGLNSILSYSNVEEVVLDSGDVIHRYPAITSSDSIDNHLTFRKITDTSEDRVHCQGRIILIDEQASHTERTALMVLYAFYIRLQNEDQGFIQAFLERHLNLRNAMRLPYHWQQMSPPELDSSQQTCYKRVTLSCHITYLSLQFNGADITESNITDRISRFSITQSSDGKASRKVYQASSSVLLTIVVPEQSTSREEELSLLKAPQGLWTVLVLNSASRSASEQTSPQYLTPIAQYLRGIAMILRTQRVNAEIMHQTLRDQLKERDDDTLFDDEHFSKSSLYHWIVKACDELRDSIASSLRFIKRLQNTQLNTLCRDAHTQEKLGIEYWTLQLEEEVYAFAEFQAQISGLNAQVQEKRNALHGITAVLEARATVQQGERMKTLAYLATLYLPLTASTSLYSMAVLPSSATLWSFFVVFAAFLACTMCMAMFLKTITTTVLPSVLSPLSAFAHPIRSFRKSTLTSEYLRHYRNLLCPSPMEGLRAEFDWPVKPAWISDLPRLLNISLSLPWHIFRRFPANLVHYVLVHELMFLWNLVVIFHYRNNRFVGFRWSFIWFLRDLIRAMLLPLDAALIVAILAWLVTLDIIFGSCRLFWSVLCICKK